MVRDRSSYGLHFYGFTAQVRGVMEVQDLHVWGLKPGVPLLAAHLIIRPSANPQAVLDAATKACQQMSIQHSTIQVLDWSPCFLHLPRPWQPAASSQCHALGCCWSATHCRAGCV